MPEHPEDILGQAQDALGAVSDLLCSVDHRDNLHLVRPSNLYALLELVRRQMQAAEQAYRDRRQP